MSDHPQQVEPLKISQVVEMLCRSTLKWAVHVFGFDGWGDFWTIEEILVAAPYLDLDEHGQILMDGNAVFLFPSEGDAQEFYESLPTDDHPPDEPGGVRFYARLYSPINGLVCEST